MKISIIGGGGLVGSCTAFALQAAGVGNHIALLDANAEMAAGQALDLLHGASISADQQFSSGGYEHVSDSDVICITAGLRRKPDESRLDLINRNVDLFGGILQDIRTAGPKSSAIVVVVSNPVDVLAYLAADMLDLPSSQVIGLGTVLDSVRFRSLIAQQLDIAPTQLSAVILGEHGDSMVPIWSSATVGGMPLDKHPAWNTNLANELFARTKGSGAEVIKRKGGAGFAVGLSIRDVIAAIEGDLRRIMPVSSVQAGAYGIRDVALSLPTVVGREGVLGVHEFELWPKEMQGLRQSGQVLRGTVDKVLTRLGTAR